MAQLLLVDQEGKKVTLGTQIGRRGGEGSVFEAISHSGYAVKLYHEPTPTEKAAKLWHLGELARTEPRLLTFAAWPTSIVWKDAQTPCGFLMPLVKGKEVHQLFGPRERCIEFPSTSWDFLIHVARNCAVAFDSVHRLGAVIGDVNEGNLLVAQDGTVRLIDCDSYQVQDGTRTWTCDVGIPLWTPPELQGMQFRGLQRTRNHDLFGLAVMIFKILFMGRHPYAGIPTRATGDFHLEAAIAQFLFAYSVSQPTAELLPPPHSLTLAALPRSCGDLFDRAFTRGSEKGRPEAVDWAGALELLQKDLAKCGRDSTHKYPRSSQRCPWCEIADAGGPSFFFISATITEAFSTADAGFLWSAITRVEQITFTTKRLDEVQFAPIPGAPLPDGIRRHNLAFIFGCLLLGFSVYLLFSGATLLGFAVIMFGFGLMSNGPRSSEFAGELARRIMEFFQCDKTLRKLFEELSSIPEFYHNEFAKRQHHLKETYERYAGIDRERQAEIRKLEQKKKEVQLREFLDRQLIKHAQIEGIGRRRAATLEAYGIESALDITASMNVPGIGDEYANRLLAWRHWCEGKFRFNAAAPLPVQELHQLNVRINTLRNNLLHDLKRGPQVLVDLGSAARSEVKKLEAKIDEGIRRMAKAHADVLKLK